MASNNFLQWNAGKANQDTDNEYVIETQRIGGAVSGLFPSKLANKLFYQCSIMVAAMGEMMKDKGFEMSDAVFADLITSLSHILTDAQFGSSAGTVCQGNDPRLDRELPTATKVWFWQNTAPTGWTIDVTAAADAVLAVKAGSGTYAVAGGSSAGTWTQPTHTHTGGSHTHTVANHTHTVADHTHSFTGIDHLHAGPSHTHSFTGINHLHAFTAPNHTHATAGHQLNIAELAEHHHTTYSLLSTGGPGASYGNGYLQIFSQSTQPTGGGQAHDHGNTSGANESLSSSTGAADRSLAGTTGASGTGKTGAADRSLAGTTGASGTGNTGGADRSLAGTTGASGAQTSSASGAQTSSASGTQTTGASATVNTWRPVANVGIICSRNA